MMSEYASKSKENKNMTVSDHVSQRLKSEPAVYIVDNRPKAVAQRTMQEAINNSPRVQQLKAHQQMTNNYTPGIAQRKEKLSNEIPQPAQRKENKTGLPNNLKTGVESLSGISMDDVKVHYNSGKPAQLQAHAFAQGTNIHLAPGQEKHLPHEAWHVVQQKQGRVQPTLQTKNKLNVNDDSHLEAEADRMGAKADAAVPVEQDTAQLSSASTSGSEVFQLEKKFGFELQASNGWIGVANDKGKYDLQMGKKDAMIGRLAKVTSDDRDIELITTPVPATDEKAKEAVREDVVAIDRHITSGTEKAETVLSAPALAHLGSAAPTAVFTPLTKPYISVTPANRILNYKVQFTFGAGLSELNGTMRAFLNDDRIWRDSDDGKKAVERETQIMALENVPDPNTPIGGLTSILIASATAIMFNKAGKMNKDIVHFMQRTRVKAMYDKIGIEDKRNVLYNSLRRSFGALGLNWDRDPLVNAAEYRKERMAHFEKLASLEAAYKLAEFLRKAQERGRRVNNKDEIFHTLKTQLLAGKEEEVTRDIEWGRGKGLYITLTLKGMTDHLIDGTEEELHGLFNLWNAELDTRETAELEKKAGEPATIMEGRRIKNTAGIGEAHAWMHAVGDKFKGKAEPAPGERKL
jgi:hypothetical protein